METIHAYNMAQTTPSLFTVEGLMWMTWLVVGIIAIWMDLMRKYHFGFVGLAAFATVLASFSTPLLSQVLLFAFLSAAFATAEKIHLKHSKLKHHFVH